MDLIYLVQPNRVVQQTVYVPIQPLRVVAVEPKKCPQIMGINGKSAYEIAVDNGFQGTVEEWLLSLPNQLTWSSSNW